MFYEVHDEKSMPLICSQCETPVNQWQSHKIDSDSLRDSYVTNLSNINKAGTEACVSHC